jgi:hypothetical protein
MHQIADPILAYWQLRMVRLPALGLPLWVPFGLSLNQIPTRSGIDFENSNKIDCSKVSARFAERLEALGA